MKEPQRNTGLLQAHVDSADVIMKLMGVERVTLNLFEEKVQRRERTM